MVTIPATVTNTASSSTNVTVKASESDVDFTDMLIDLFI